MHKHKELLLWDDKGIHLTRYGDADSASKTENSGEKFRTLIPTEATDEEHEDNQTLRWPLTEVKGHVRVLLL